MTDCSAKAAYVAPALVELGSFEEMTQAKQKGLHLDGTYGAGTPVSQGILS